MSVLLLFVHHMFVYIHMHLPYNVETLNIMLGNLYRAQIPKLLLRVNINSCCHLYAVSRYIFVLTYH